MKIKKAFYHIKSICCFVWFFLNQRVKSNIKINNNSVIYLTFLGIRYDGRVRKSVDALLSKGYSVEIIKPVDAQDDDVVAWHPNLTITSLGLSGSFSHFPYIFDWKIFNHLMRSDASRIYCRDLFTGVMGTLVGKKTGKTTIVDFYEWYSEAKEYDYVNKKTKQKSLWKKKLFKFYERYICKNADQLITNNLSFAKGIAQGIVSIKKFNIIRNIPDDQVIKTDEKYNLRGFLPTLHHSKKILYYVGQLSFDRKLDTIILGMKELPDCVLIIQGSGHYVMQKMLAEKLSQSESSDRIFFLPPVPDCYIISYASTADVGVFICDSQDNKMYNALPNKLFEYVYAGIPQVSSKGPEIEHIFKNERIGVLFDAYDSQTFSKAVQAILDHKNYDLIKESVLSYRKHLYLMRDFDDY